MSVKVAVIGTGWTERVQIPAFKIAGLEVVGVASRDPRNAERVAAEHAIPHATGRWQDLLEGEAELISVATPPSLHHDQALAVLEAGKHLLCEKPLALDADQAAAMTRAARAHPEQLALVDHELRFLPARLKARELLAGGSIGRPLLVTARVASNLRIDPTQPWTWWSDASQGGGILGAIGSHVLDGVRWLLGGEAPIELSGASLSQTYPSRRDAAGVERDVTADDIASLTFKVDRAVGTALIHGASLDDPIDMLTIRGSEGTLVLDRSLKLYYGKRDGVLKEYVTHLPPLIPNRFRASPYAAGTVLLGRAIADALGHGSRDALAHAATLDDGAAVQRLLDRARALAA